MSAMRIVGPFLEVVRSEETSGAVTGAALSSLATLLRHDLLKHTVTLCRASNSGGVGAETVAVGVRADAAEAMSELVEAVSSCRFEFTDSRRDEVVKMQIIDVLRLAVTTAGEQLTDESVWHVVQDCFIHRNTVVHSLTLCHAAEEALFEVIGIVFKRFREILEPTTPPPPPPPSSSGSWPSGGGGGEALPDPLEPAASCFSPPPQSPAAAASGAGAAATAAPPSSAPEARERSGSGFSGVRSQRSDSASAAASAPLRSSFGLPCAVKVLGFLCSQLQKGPVHHHSHSHHQPPSSSSNPTAPAGGSGGGGGGDDGGGGGGGSGGSSGAAERDATRRLCFKLIRHALEVSGGQACCACDPVVCLVRDDLCASLLWVGQGGQQPSVVSPETLSEGMAVLKALWDKPFRRVLKIQFEAFLVGVFLRQLKHLACLAEQHGDDAARILAGAMDQQQQQQHTSRGSSSSSNSNSSGGGSGSGGSGSRVKGGAASSAGSGGKGGAGKGEGSGGGGEDAVNGYDDGGPPASLIELEIFLECLVDLMSEPSFLDDLFINYDCDLAREDVLECLVSLLSCVARSPSPALAVPARPLAMAALLAGLHALSARCAPPPSSSSSASSTSSSSGGPMPPCLPLSSSPSPPLPPPPPASSSSSLLTSLGPSHPLWQRKLRKRLLKAGALKFNAKPRSGLQALMESGLLPTPLTPEAVVKFLRTAPGLDKAVVGSFLGEAGKTEKEITEKTFIADTAVFHQLVLKNFGDSFDFKGQPMVVALRMFLSAFRLPGEAQQIDRVIQAFADAAFVCCEEGKSGVLPTPDAVYLLAFSIIMLHTDLHNPNIRPEKRMKVADFIKNNTNYGEEICKGQDIPSELLVSIYKHIAENEFETHSNPGTHTAEDLKATTASGTAAATPVHAALSTTISSARWRDLLRSVDRDPSSGLMLSPALPPNDGGGDGATPGLDSVGGAVGGGGGGGGACSTPQDGLELASSLLRAPSALPLTSLAARSSSASPPPPAAAAAGAPPPPASAGEVGHAAAAAKAEEVLTFAPVDAMVLLLVWKPAIEATAGLFLLGKAAGTSASPSSLRQAVDASLVLAKLLAWHKMQQVFDTLVFMLCGFTGLLVPWPISPHDKYAFGTKSQNQSGTSSQGSGADSAAAAAKSGASVRADAAAAGGGGGGGGGLGSSSSPLVTPSLNAEVSLLRELATAPAARMAGVAVFGIAHRLGDALRDSWQPVLRLVFRMRDLHLIDPSSGLLSESDPDFLDPKSRRNFNDQIQTLRRRFLRQRRRAARSQQQQLQQLSRRRGARGGGGGSSGGGGILSWLWGSSSAPADDDEEDEEDDDRDDDDEEEDEEGQGSGDSDDDGDEEEEEDLKQGGRGSVRRKSSDQGLRRSGNRRKKETKTARVKPKREAWNDGPHTEAQQWGAGGAGLTSSTSSSGVGGGDWSLLAVQQVPGGGCGVTVAATTTREGEEDEEDDDDEMVDGASLADGKNADAADSDDDDDDEEEEGEDDLSDTGSEGEGDDGEGSYNDPDQDPELARLLRDRQSLRRVVRQQLLGACQVGELVRDSVRLSDESLWALCHALTAAIHAHLPPEERSLFMAVGAANAASGAASGAPGAPEPSPTPTQFGPGSTLPPATDTDVEAGEGPCGGESGGSGQAPSASTAAAAAAVALRRQTLSFDESAGLLPLNFLAGASASLVPAGGSGGEVGAASDEKPASAMAAPPASVHHQRGAPPAPSSSSSQSVRRQVYLPPLSPASVPFAEVILCEVSLLNRKRRRCRFSSLSSSSDQEEDPFPAGAAGVAGPVMWPLLREHYSRRLSGAQVVSVGVEKAAVGLLRLVAHTTQQGEEEEAAVAGEDVRLMCAEGLALLLQPSCSTPPPLPTMKGLQQPVADALAPLVGFALRRTVLGGTSGGTKLQAAASSSSSSPPLAPPQAAAAPACSLCFVELGPAAHNWAPLLSLLTSCAPFLMASSSASSFSSTSPSRPNGGKKRSSKGGSTSLSSPSASAGAKAAFEALSALLKDDRLEAHVPAPSAVSAVRAFLAAPGASASLCSSAVDLLAVLHRRLDPSLSSSAVAPSVQAPLTVVACARGGAGSGSGSGAGAWQPVWFAVLEALAVAGCLHPRFPSVRSHASLTLRHALVRDSHASALERACPQEMHRLLLNTLCPLAHALLSSSFEHEHSRRGSESRRRRSRAGSRDATGQGSSSSSSGSNKASPLRQGCGGGGGQDEPAAAAAACGGSAVKGGGGGDVNNQGTPPSSASLEAREGAGALGGALGQQQQQQHPSPSSLPSLPPHTFGAASPWPQSLCFKQVDSRVLSPHWCTTSSTMATSTISQSLFNLSSSSSSWLLDPHTRAQALVLETVCLCFLRHLRTMLPLHLPATSAGGTPAAVASGTPLEPAVGPEQPALETAAAGNESAGAVVAAPSASSSSGGDGESGSCSSDSSGGVGRGGATSEAATAAAVKGGPFVPDPPFHDLWLKVLALLQLRLLDPHVAASSLRTSSTAPPPPVPAAEATTAAAAAGQSYQQPHGQSGAANAASLPGCLTPPLALHGMSVEYLKVLLLSLAELGAFTPGERTVGRELWELTWTVLQHGAAGVASAVCSALLQSALFPDSDFGNPPPPTGWRGLPPASAAALLSSLSEQDAVDLCAMQALATTLPDNVMTMLTDSASHPPPRGSSAPTSSS